MMREELAVSYTYGKTLAELAEENEDVIVLEADLMKAMGTKVFLERFPDYRAIPVPKRGEILLNAALRKALGLDQLPEESNLRRQFTQASNKEVERMRKTISENLAKANQTDKTVEIGLDIDSTVATVYGKQEGAEVGYNPTKRGRPSYSIKTVFIANNGDCVNLRLDGGKSHSKKGFKEFFQRTLSLLPLNYKVVFVRLDKGYFGENTFEYLEEEGIRYVTASKNTGPLRKKAASLSDKEWEEIEKDSLYFTEIEYSYSISFLLSQRRYAKNCLNLDKKQVFENKE